MFKSFALPHYQLDTTDWLTERVVSLPVHTEMETEQLEYIVRHVLNFVNR
jgi:dTDP-4-amino-4,6-dideoxygalactose transaminase